MQPTVDELLKLGPLPDSREPDLVKLKRFETLLAQTNLPISDDDARALLKLFGPDDSFGLAWTLLHLIETAPGWPLDDALSESGNEWIDRLRTRAKR